MADITFATNFLNLTYGDGDLVHQTTVRANPSIKLFKIVKAGGASVDSRFMLRGAAGYSSNLTDAQSIAAQNKNGRHYSWRVGYGKTEGSFRVSYDDILQSDMADVAEAKALELEMDKGIAEGGSKLVQLIFGRAGLAGGVGVYNDGASAPAPVFSVLFTDGSDARNFAPGDNVVIAPADGIAAQSLVGEVGYVIRQDVENGWIQVTSLLDIATAANPGAWITGTTYFVFNLGLVSTAGTPQDIVVPLEAYLPAAAANDTFLNVARSDSSSLSGARLNAAEEVGDIITRAKRLISKQRGRYTDVKGKATLVLNAEDFGTADEQLSAAVNRPKSGSNAEMTDDGYQRIMVNTAAGQTEVISEPYKNKGSGFLLCNENLILHSCLGNGKILDLVRGPGGMVARLMEGSNDWEVRTISKLAVTIGAPYSHGRFNTTA